MINYSYFVITDFFCVITNVRLFDELAIFT